MVRAHAVVAEYRKRVRIEGARIDVAGLPQEAAGADDAQVRRGVGRQHEGLLALVQRRGRNPPSGCCRACRRRSRKPRPWRAAAAARASSTGRSHAVESFFRRGDVAQALLLDAQRSSREPMFSRAALPVRADQLHARAEAPSSRDRSARSRAGRARSGHAHQRRRTVWIRCWKCTRSGRTSLSSTRRKAASARGCS